jgi:Cys-tRNA(Pro)/Cys-tRNA(Cys) deacylase
MKTNAIRLLEQKKIEHSTYDYEVDENDLSGETVSAKLNAPAQEVFKTLIAEGDRTGVVVFCIPVSSELNLRKAALVTGNKRINMVKTKDLLDLSGYIRGGCSPIGMKKKYPTFIDETAQILNQIYVSAGVRGTQVKLSPSDLQEITQAKLADLV